MGRPYSQDLRDRILWTADGGVSPTEVAELFEVTISYVSKVLSRQPMMGMTTTLP